MKLISLNTWGGKLFGPLIEFIKQYSSDTDIFCFQEIYKTNSEVKQYKNIRANLLDELAQALPSFQYFYTGEINGYDPAPTRVNFDLSVGKTIFIKNNIVVHENKNLLLYGNPLEEKLKKDFSNLSISLQSIKLTIQNKDYIIVNVHGTAFPGTKLDTDLRIDHSAKIKEFLNPQPGAKILVGDFNLLPQTQSIKIIESFLRNLIKEYNIEKTRSRLSPFFGRKDFQKFADYTFVSEDVIVKSFQVPDVAISDHLPMVLEFF